MTAVDAVGIGKRFSNKWALRGCSLSIPLNSVTALVGPNGAGKTTLLRSIVGLSTPDEGEIRILGDLRAGSRLALERVGFVAQEAPLHDYLRVRDMVKVADNLNERFSAADALGRIRALDIGLSQKIGTLSGGQKAQVALALTLARHPKLLVLDEPLARLDPLARFEFMGVVMSSVVDDGLTVVFSSHVVSELERVADYLIVLGSGTVQLSGSIQQLMSSHGLLHGPTVELDLVDRSAIVATKITGRRASILIRVDRPLTIPRNWEVDDVSLEELVLAYLREPTASAFVSPLALAEGA